MCLSYSHIKCFHSQTQALRLKCADYHLAFGNRLIGCNRHFCSSWSDTCNISLIINYCNRLVVRSPDKRHLSISRSHSNLQFLRISYKETGHQFLIESDLHRFLHLRLLASCKNADCG